MDFEGLVFSDHQEEMWWIAFRKSGGLSFFIAGADKDRSLRGGQVIHFM